MLLFFKIPRESNLLFNAFIRVFQIGLIVCLEKNIYYKHIIYEVIFENKFISLYSKAHIHVKKIRYFFHPKVGEVLSQSVN